MKPLPVSLVLVSDYEPGQKSWADERTVLKAYLSDPNGVPDEIIVMESRSVVASADDIPHDIAALFPRVSVWIEDATASAELKDAALQHCTHELVAVAEADCLPLPGWLAALVEEIDADDGYSAVSGRTVYAGDTSLMRVLSLLDRGFMDVLQNDQFTHVSNNGALYRKELLERHPYPTGDTNPFVSAEIRLMKMVQAGARFGVRASSVMHHAYGGLGFIFDLRRNKGYQAAAISAIEQRHSGLHVVMSALLRRIADDWTTVRGASRHYIRWRDWPLLTVVFVAVRVPELVGAWQATRMKNDFKNTTPYR